MTRFAATAFFLIALTGSIAFAQDSFPKVQVFAGYSWMHTGSGGLNGETVSLDLRQNPGTLGIGSNSNGWNAEAQYNFDRWIGIVADFAGQYGTPITAQASGVSGLPTESQYSIMAGPVVSYRTKGKFTPFVHALFGWDRVSLGASTIVGGPTPVTSVASTYTDFAIAGGGGVDYKVSRRLSLRLAQLDYFRTTLDLNSLYGDAFGPGRFQGLPTKGNDFRYSGGIVLRY